MTGTKGFFTLCLQGVFVAMLAYPFVVMYATTLAQAITLGIARGKHGIAPKR